MEFRELRLGRVTFEPEGHVVVAGSGITRADDLREITGVEGLKTRIMNKVASGASPGIESGSGEACDPAFTIHGSDAAVGRVIGGKRILYCLYPCG